MDMEEGRSARRADRAAAAALPVPAPLDDDACSWEVPPLTESRLMMKMVLMMIIDGRRMKILCCSRCPESRTFRDQTSHFFKWHCDQRHEKQKQDPTTRTDERPLMVGLD